MSVLPYDAEDDEELFDDMYPVVSATECTGLTPSPPETDYAVASYSRIYDIPLSKSRKRRGEHRS